MKEPKHPGELIRAAMKGKRVTQVVLSREVRMTQSYLSEVLSGKRPMTPPVCLGLERLGVGDADDWYSMYTRYELAQARKQSSPQTAR